MALPASRVGVSRKSVDFDGNVKGVPTPEQIEKLEELDSAMFLPETAPVSREIVTVETDGSQGALTIGSGLSVNNGELEADAPDNVLVLPETAPVSREIVTVETDGSQGALTIGSGLSVNNGELEADIPDNMLVLPETAPLSTELVGIDTSGDQVGITIGSGLSLDANNELSASGGSGFGSRVIGDSSATGTITSNTTWTAPADGFLFLSLGGSANLESRWSYSLRRGSSGSTSDPMTWNHNDFSITLKTDNGGRGDLFILPVKKDERYFFYKETTETSQLTYGFLNLHP